MRSWLALFLVLSCLTACKSTDDYLRDLESLSPDPPGGVNFLVDRTLVFDAGQLGHEALAGLATAEEMNFSQVMLSLRHACEFLGRARHNTLLQAESATLIGMLVSRYPIPPIDEPLIPITDAQPSIDKIHALMAAYEPLSIETQIELLDAADEVVVMDAERQLKERSDQDFGRDVDAWRTWFEANRGRYMEAWAAESRAPLEYIGRSRYRNYSEARGMLSWLALWVHQYGYVELADTFVPTLKRIARQASVYALVESMQRNKDSTVRAHVAEAMMLIRDPAFGEPLASQLPLERNSYAAAKMVRALQYYPSRMTIEQIMTAMALGDDQLNVNAAEVLFAITGQDLGTDREAWLEWWKSTGDKEWR